eukprot:1159374-Pelagomonas_calceolata.AAC.3
MMPAFDFALEKCTAFSDFIVKGKASCSLVTFVLREKDTAIYRFCAPPPVIFGLPVTRGWHGHGCVHTATSDTRVTRRYRAADMTARRALPLHPRVRDSHVEDTDV